MLTRFAFHKTSRHTLQTDGSSLSLVAQANHARLIIPETGLTALQCFTSGSIRGLHNAAQRDNEAHV